MLINIGRYKCLVKLRVGCPKCQATQFTKTTLSVRCFRCDRVYKVFPKKGESRILYVDGGTKEEVERQYYEQRKDNKK